MGVGVCQQISAEKEIRDKATSVTCAKALEVV